MSEKTVEELRKELAAKKAARAAANAEGDERARLEREIADETAMAEAEATLGRPGIDFCGVQTPDGIVIARRPGHGKLRGFAKLKDPSLEEVDAFVLPCVTYPSRDRYQEIAEKYGLLPLRLANALVDLGGISFKEAKGKS